MTTTYKIEPRVKKSLFRKNKLFFDLIKETEKEEWVYNGVDSDLVKYVEHTKLFTSENTEEVLKMKEKIIKLYE